MFKASKKKTEGKAGKYLNYNEFSTAIAFMALLYYSKPENSTLAPEDTNLGKIQSLFKWITKKNH